MTTTTGPIGAVATSHYLATEAGAEALRRGGNAIDAGIAAAAALCVVYPNNVALGGDLVALVRDPQGQVRFVNATGPAPAAASLEEMRAKHGRALPARGVDTITVPGGVAGWDVLAGLGGQLDWPARLEAARRHAEASPVARSVAAALREGQTMLQADPGARAVFFPGGEPLREGQTLRQPALARSLERLAAHGPAEFYTGELGATWRAGLQALGSRISEEDTRTYAPVVEKPLSADVFGLRIHTGQPNTQGFSLLRTLLALHHDQAPFDAPYGADAARVAALFHEGNQVRGAHLADPDVMRLSAEELLTVPAPASAPVPTAATGDTVGLTAVSADGWAVSLVQSVYKSFGAGILEPETGILFQDRGTAFSLDPAHPAAFTPGRRPPHTLMPVLAEQDGALRYVTATMGGQAQPQIHAHLLLRLLGGASPLEATSSPRWVVDVPRENGDVPAIVEADVDAQARAAIGDAGFTVTAVPPRDEDLGHSNVIEIRDGGYRAASDPRSDGSAVVIA